MQDNMKIKLFPFNGDLQVLWKNSFEGYSGELCYRLILNGKEVTGTFPIDEYTDNPPLEQLIKHLSEKLATMMVLNVYQKADYSAKQIFDGIVR